MVENPFHKFSNREKVVVGARYATDLLDAVSALWAWKSQEMLGGHSVEDEVLMNCLELAI
jgi:hypothetical protein